MTIHIIPTPYTHTHTHKILKPPQWLETRQTTGEITRLRCTTPFGLSGATQNKLCLKEGVESGRETVGHKDFPLVGAAGLSHVDEKWLIKPDHRLSRCFDSERKGRKQKDKENNEEQSGIQSTH